MLRQRNALLRQAGGRLDEDGGVHPRRVGRQAGGGGRGAGGRPAGPAGPTAPVLASTYDALARRPARVAAAYEAAACPVVAGVGPARRAGVGAGGGPGRRRAATTCAAACRPSGPTATRSTLSIGGAPARTQASQGEQRTLALALRLAVAPTW